MDELQEMIERITGEVAPDDPYGRTNMEVIADKLLEDALAGHKEACEQLRRYQTELRPILHSALDKKIRHAVK